MAAFGLRRLARGDQVAATARNVESLSSLTQRYGKQVAALKLDVTDKAEVHKAIAETHKRFGRLDVVINNAGYGLFGTIEEVSEQEARAQIETNLFGALWVTQEALPIMRAQGSGHRATAIPAYDSAREKIAAFAATMCRAIPRPRVRPF